MQLICAMFGHRPGPFGMRRRDGKCLGTCVLCHKPLVRHRAGGWMLVDEDEPEPR